MIPSIRQLALSLYASSRRTERLPLHQEWLPDGAAWVSLPCLADPGHDRWASCLMALPDEGGYRDTEDIFAGL